MIFDKDCKNSKINFFFNMEDHYTLTKVKNHGRSLIIAFC